MTVAIFLCSLCGAMMLGMPIAFALLTCGIALMVHLGMFDVRILAQNLIIGADSFALMAVPFFILVGELMNAGGISKRIIGFGMALVGHIRGGLGYVAIIAAFIFAGLSGSAVADTAALCAIMVPMMGDSGYSKSGSAALIGAGGIVAMILPPSIAFIVFGAVGGVSVVKLFMAGIFPGILLCLSLAAMWWYISRKKQVAVFPRSTAKQLLHCDQGGQLGTGSADSHHGRHQRRGGDTDRGGGGGGVLYPVSLFCRLSHGEIRRASRQYWCRRRRPPASSCFSLLRPWSLPG